MENTFNDPTVWHPDTALQILTALGDEQVRSQMSDPLRIPVLIINFNQLEYLKRLINFLLRRGFTRIVILDNKSDYGPLLDYYTELEANPFGTIHMMDQNYGHRVFFLNPWLQEKYGTGFYVLTDADIVPNEHCPEDFMQQFVQTLLENASTIVKVGFALKVSDIPDWFPLKASVLSWEERFWADEIRPYVFRASIDTTFALYLPKYPALFSEHCFYSAFRFAGDFEAMHGGWYHDPDSPTAEYLHYSRTASASHSWRISGGEGGA